MGERETYLNHEKKELLLSIECWLFNRNPCNGLFIAIPTCLGRISSPIYPKQPVFSSLIWSFTTQKPIPSRNKPALNLRYIPMMGALFQSSQHLQPSIGVSFLELGAMFFDDLFFTHSFGDSKSGNDHFYHASLIQKTITQTIQNDNANKTHTQPLHICNTNIFIQFSLGYHHIEKHQFWAKKNI